MQGAGRPLAAAEMVLVRIAYAADLPTPDEVIRSLGERRRDAPRGAGNGARRLPRGAPRRRARDASRRATTRRAAAPRARAGAQRRPAIRSRAAPSRRADADARASARFEDLIALAGEKRDMQIKTALERDVRLVRFEDGRLEIALEPSAPQDAGQRSLRASSREWTGRRWMVVVSAEQGAADGARRRSTRGRPSSSSGVRADPLVQAVLAALSRRRDRRRARARAMRRAAAADDDGRWPTCRRRTAIRRR